MSEHFCLLRSAVAYIYDVSPVGFAETPGQSPLGSRFHAQFCLVQCEAARSVKRGSGQSDPSDTVVRAFSASGMVALRSPARRFAAWFLPRPASCAGAYRASFNSGTEVRVLTCAALCATPLTCSGESTACRAFRC